MRVPWALEIPVPWAVEGLGGAPPLGYLGGATTTLNAFMHTATAAAGNTTILNLDITETSSSNFQLRFTISYITDA